MSWVYQRPMRVAGANTNSGNINTGEQLMTQGGCQAFSVYSGAVVPALTGAPGAVAVGSDILFYSGAGRLKDIIPHAQLSGVQITFYDAGAIASGGPFALSGSKILAIVPANTWTSFGGVFGVGPVTYAFDMPFQSGLCTNSRSGQPGFTASWIPETNPTPGGFN